MGATLLSMGAAAAAGMGAFGLLQHTRSPSATSLTGTTSGAAVAPTQSSTSAKSAAGPGASKTAKTSRTGAVSLGPLLSSQSYATYAVQIYPGPLSPTAQLATTGFNIHVTPTSQGLDVSIGGAVKQAVTFPTATKVYFIDATLGDDSPPSGEYNQADDGLRATNVQGRIVR